MKDTTTTIDEINAILKLNETIFVQDGMNRYGWNLQTAESIYQYISANYIHKDKARSYVLEVIGEDEEIPMENRMSDIEQVRLSNQVSKVVYGRNGLRAEQRAKLDQTLKAIGE